MRIHFLLLLIPLMSEAANYSAGKAVVDGVEVIRLGDAARKTEVLIAPSIGNIAYQMNVNGKNAFWFPYASVGELKAKPTLCGNPFLAPWANRLDQDAFYANGRKYLLNDALGNLRRDQNRNPIHGLLSYSADWQVAAVEADERSARVVSRLEFWKHPELMAQFPFAHTIEMTYRLENGRLQVETALRNHSTDPMPVAVGFHPYFRLHDAPRDRWKVHLAARDHLVLSRLLIPTGERKPVNFSDPVSLEGSQLDDVFSGLVRDADGRAEFWVEGEREKISVVYGPKYSVAVVYAPRGRDFICFEPMSAVTNAFNLAHAGIYKELQSVPPGGEWRESYWITATGF
jgi:aldose 1-epimerase